jgi:hypothetical protein
MLILKLLGKIHQGVAISNDFQNKITTAWEIIGRIAKCNYIKLKSFYIGNMRVKKWPTEWRKIFSSY